MAVGYLFLVDAVMVALALAALLSAVWERRRIVKHWHVLLPGLFSLAASVAVVAYPRVTNLWEVQRVMIAVLVLLLGALRGRFMKLASDRVHNVAALRNPADSILVAALLAAFAGLDMVLDIKAGGLTEFTLTIELVLIVAAAYLLGRSVTLWTHVRTSAHVDLIAR